MKRYIIYPIATLFVITLLLLPQVLTSPQRNIRSVLRATNGKTTTSQQSFSSFFKPYPNKGYILVLYTGDSPGFGSVQFVTINKMKGELIIDLITGPGEENIKQLRGDEAKAFISQHNIDLQEVDSKVFNE